MPGHSRSIPGFWNRIPEFADLRLDGAFQFGSQRDIHDLTMQGLPKIVKLGAGSQIRA